MNVTTLRPGADDPRRVLVAEHDRLSALCMLLCDRVEHERRGDHSLHPRRLRREIGRALVVSAGRVDNALAELGLIVIDNDRPQVRDIANEVGTNPLHAVD